MTPDPSELLRDLIRPDAWPAGVPVAGGITVEQTHISLVFLADRHVLKLKKPVRLAFADFSTPSLRRAACEAECRLNARWAPDTYLGVVTVSADGDRLRVELRPPGDGEEPAVLMRRLPSERTLASLLERGELDAARMRTVARAVAAFHDRAAAGPEVQRAAGWPALASVVRGNLDECAPFVGATLQPELHARLVAECGRQLEEQRDLVAARASRGMGRDGHGDLRLDHVYLGVGDPDEVLAIDCIEFRDDFRQGDPVADVAFLVMELRHEGRADLADVLFGEWCDARGDAEAARLLPLHVGHRHAVRAKVRSIESREPEVQGDARERASQRARGHFLAALDAWATPARRPALLLVAGLPGSGKSTVARALAAHAFTRVSSDATRKSLARTGRIPGDLYSPAATDLTYASCLDEARERLLRGERVVLDASFHESARRLRALHAARDLHVRTAILHCTASDAEASARLAARRGDESDADASIRELMASRWEEPSAEERSAWREVSTAGSREDAVQRALAALVADGLA